jgi:hypothetical protein
MKRYTLSSLIKKLQEIEAKHGDIKVGCYGHDGCDQDDEINVYRWHEDEPYSVQLVLERDS